MRLFAAALLTAALAAPPLRAQDPEPRPIHVSDALLRQPVAQQAFARWTTAGPLPLAKTRPDFEVGDTTTFKVRNIAADTTNMPVFREARFVLLREHAAFRLWVEVAEIEGGHVADADLDSLYSALASETPPGSIDSNEGIIVNNEDVFGQPPNIFGNPREPSTLREGDGKADVLITDIKDEWAPGQGFVAGFVDPLDVYSVEANRRAILYLDTVPGLFTPSGGSRGTEGLEETAAHEYQHLIHLNYDPNEFTFINEGLSEFASLINGYPPRAMTYLRGPANYNVPLFRWSIGVSDEVLEDYQRAGLFTAYIAERIGVEATGSITRQTPNSYDGYRVVLDDFGLDVEEVVFDFHTANLINDPSVPPYFYARPSLAGVRAQPVFVDDGRTDTNTPRGDVAVENGGTTYLSWEDVTDFSVLIDVVVDDESDAASLIARRDRIQIRAVLYRDGAVLAVEAFEPSLNRQVFEGSYDRIDLVVTSVDPRPAEVEEPNGVHLFYEAGWNGDEQVAVERVVYDTGAIAVGENDVGEEQAELYRLAPEAILVNAFPVPEGGRLEQVSVAPFYESQFSNTGVPENAPTDFTLHVWAPGETDLLGEELLALDVDDHRANRDTTLVFHTVDLEAYADVLSPLPDTVFVGISNAGGDGNYIVLGVSRYTGPNVSYLSLPSFNPGGEPVFRPLPRVSDVFADRVLPIRATFVIETGVAVDEPAEIPDRLALDQNYPNPFNPSTTIRYHLPRADDVRLAVYDALGRRVAVLVDGRQAAGAHQVELDAARWASGTYFYTLETRDHRLSRAMLLIK